MLTDVVDFFPDIQSINPTKYTGFVLFCDTDKEAVAIQYQLTHDFNMPSSLDIDYYGARYIVPLEDVDADVALKFIRRGWSWDRDQQFNRYLITLYSEDAANKIYDIMIAHGYNVTLSPNKMQLVVKCIADSPRNTAITELKREFDTFERKSPKSIDDYFNKILFNGVIENPEYRKVREQKFSPETIKQNKDLIIREIVYRYFNIIIYAYLTCPKFDANKLDDTTIQNINLVRDFLCSVADKYIDTQIDVAGKASQQPTINFGCLTTCREYDNFNNVLNLAKKWHRADIKNERAENRNIRMSQRWAYKLMDLNDGYYIVCLGGQEALDYENRTLKHPVEIFYQDDIYEGIARYSIRKGYTPILTLKVDNDKVVRCYGYENVVPCDSTLRAVVRTFMRERELTIPDNSWNKLIGYIKKNGKLYDIDNLPKGFILDDILNLEEMGLKKLPDMSTVKVNGHLLLHGNNLHDLKGAPYRVSGNLDASGNPLESLYGLPREIGGLILLPKDKLTAESFVPLYIEDKLKKGDVLGVDETVSTAWQDQIEQRKIGIANIIASLRDRNQ